jgi:hypothetical protein
MYLGKKALLNKQETTSKSWYVSERNMVFIINYVQM